MGLIWEAYNILSDLEKVIGRFCRHSPHKNGGGYVRKIYIGA